MAATGTVAKDTGKSLARTLSAGRMVTLARVPDGYVGKALGDLARTVKGRTVFVARDGQRLAEIERALAFFAPEVEPLPFPAWDCLPYDRVSPHPTVVARRMATLSRLLLPTDRPGVVLTTVNAVLQRAPSRSFVEKGSFSAAPGNQVRMADLVRWLEDNGFAAHDHRARGRRVRRARRHPRPLSGRAGEPRPARLLRRHARIDPQLRRRQPAHHRVAEARRSRSRQRDGALGGGDRAVSPGLCDALRHRRSRRSPLPVDQRGPPLCRHGALAAALLGRAGDALRLHRRLAGDPRPSRRGGGRRASRPDRGSLRGAALRPRRGAGRRPLQAAPAGPPLPRRAPNGPSGSASGRAQ